MADQFDFDPAMFGMKANHGMLRAGQGGKEPHGSNGAHQHSAPNQYTPFGGGQRGGRGGGQRGRGRGGNRGARGGGYQAGSGGHGFQGGPSAKVRYVPNIEAVKRYERCYRKFLEANSVLFAIPRDSVQITVIPAVLKALRAFSNHPC